VLLTPGVGHSAPYEDKGAYDLTVKYMFLSGPAKHPMPALHVEPFAARDVRSDFELPWIMRALVDSPEVRDLFPAELKDLREGVVGWKPVTKALKEIKKRVSTGPSCPTVPLPSCLCLRRSLYSLRLVLQASPLG
jgi:hypothetical protein